MKTAKYLLIGLMLTITAATQAKDYTATSPNGKIRVTASGSHDVNLKVELNGKLLVEATGLGLDNKTGSIRSAKVSRYAETIAAPFYRQSRFQTSGEL